jgi:hypothetical protein
LANFAKEKWEVQSRAMAKWKFKVHHYRRRGMGQDKPKCQESLSKVMGEVNGTQLGKD